MTPFGVYMRTVRAQNNITMKSLAAAIDVSPSYLSSLEHGNRGTPGKEILLKITTYFNLSEKQEFELYQAAKVSSQKLSLSGNLNPNVYSVAHLFCEVAERLSKAQLNVIEQILIDTPSLRNREAVKMVK